MNRTYYLLNEITREEKMSDAKPKLMPRKQFLKKLIRNVFFGFLISIFSLGLGMFGYQYFEGMSIVDAYVNAAMILSGMGPVTDLKTNGGKIFAGSYALFSGIVFLIIMAVIFAPVIHRFLHKFHLEEGSK